VEGDLGVLPKRYFEALPGQTFEEKRNAFVKQPIGTGPWKFVSRTVGTSIEFAANADYWDQQRVPQFARLRLIKPMVLVSTKPYNIYRALGANRTSFWGLQSSYASSMLVA
jgi:ABC-type transport system substrate-binding protein